MKLTRHVILLFAEALLLLSNFNHLTADSRIHTSSNKPAVNNVWSLRFSKEFVVGLCDCNKKGLTIKRWSLASGAEDTFMVELIDSFAAMKPETLSATWIREITLSHDGTLLALSSIRGDLGVVSLEEHRWKWKRNGVLFDTFTFTESDHDLLAVSYGDGQIERFDAQIGTKSQTHQLAEDGLSNYADGVKRFMRSKLSPDGQYVVIWNEKTNDEWGLKKLFAIFSHPPNPNIVLWDIVNKKVVSEIQKPPTWIDALAFSPDEKSVFLAFGQNRIRLWSIVDDSITREFYGKYDWGIRVSQQSNIVGVGHSSGLTIRNYSTSTIIKEFRSIDENALGAWGFSRNGEFVALETGGILHLYDTKNWEVKWSVPTCGE